MIIFRLFLLTILPFTKATHSPENIELRSASPYYQVMSVSVCNASVPDTVTLRYQAIETAKMLVSNCTLPIIIVRNFTSSISTWSHYLQNLNEVLFACLLSDAIAIWYHICKHWHFNIPLLLKKRAWSRETVKFLFFSCFLKTIGNLQGNDFKALQLHDVE